jgi:hypothetical protein
MLFLKYRLLLRLFCNENGADLPEDSAFDLSDGEVCLTLAWGGVGEAAAARAAVRRIRRGVGTRMVLFVAGGGGVGGVVKPTKFELTEALVFNGSVDAVKRLRSDAFLGAMNFTPAAQRSYLSRMFATGVFGFDLCIGFGSATGGSMISLVFDCSWAHPLATSATSILRSSDLTLAAVCGI